MSIDTQDAPVVLKAGFTPLTTVILQQNNLSAITDWLRRQRQQAPAMFENLPCVLDLAAVTADHFSLQELIATCREAGLSPIGARNCNDEWKAQLNSCQLADLGRHRQRATTSTASTPPENQTNSSTDSAEPPSNTTQRQIKIHRGNVRSGQQLYNDGDLIVMGMVSAGAEVLASGDVHIYGALRGRALAGVKGDSNAIIGCHKFEAELVAIAGQYRIFEEATEFQQKSVIVQLQEDSLQIENV